MKEKILKMLEFARAGIYYNYPQPEESKPFIEDLRELENHFINLDEATQEAESPKTCCAQSKTASKHKYWINYGTVTVEDKKPNFFHGNHEIIRDAPITCKEDFESICEQIKNEMASGQDKNILSVFVTSWTKFE